MLFFLGSLYLFDRMLGYSRVEHTPCRTDFAYHFRRDDASLRVYFRLLSDFAILEADITSVNSKNEGLLCLK